jgi:hypothetical protein
VAQLSTALSVLFVLGVAATPALAQIRSEAPVVETDGKLVLDALGHHLTMPRPDWLSGDEAALGRVETSYLGARISRDENERTLADYRAALMVLHANSCKPELTGFFQLGQDNGDNDLAPLGFVCGAYADQYRNFVGLGEIMVASFQRSDTGVAIIYQEWRGKSFNPADAKTWPVPTGVVQARAEQLKAEAALSKAD